MKFFLFFVEKGNGAFLGEKTPCKGLSLPRKGAVRGRSFALGKQRQEEMKSLIQNSLKLGEKPQTTEASNIRIYNKRKHRNNNLCLMLLLLFVLKYIIQCFE